MIKRSRYSAVFALAIGMIAICWISFGATLSSAAELRGGPSASSGKLIASLAADAPARARGRGHHHHHHEHRHHPLPPVPPGLAFGPVTVTPDGHGRRLVNVEDPQGAPMSVVEVCDLTTSDCIEASLASGSWTASLPAPDPGRFSIGLFGLSNGSWVVANAVSDPPAEVHGPVNVG